MTATDERFRSPLFPITATRPDSFADFFSDSDKVTHPRKRLANVSPNGNGKSDKLLSLLDLRQIAQSWCNG
jgi:hypothetical protein